MKAVAFAKLVPLPSYRAAVPPVWVGRLLLSLTKDDLRNMAGDVDGQTVYENWGVWAVPDLPHEIREVLEVGSSQARMTDVLAVDDDKPSEFPSLAEFERAVVVRLAEIRAEIDAAKAARSAALAAREKALAEGKATGILSALDPRDGGHVELTL